MVMICAALINTRTHTHADSFWPVILLPQPAEPKKKQHTHNHASSELAINNKSSNWTGSAAQLRVNTMTSVYLLKA